jgi:exopolyphosphatase / guanosine-5'-triphosphate,3'-diphosphate pyrophosphatase
LLAQRGVLCDCWDLEGGRTVPVIIPRWEWRSFGERFGEAESDLAARSPDQVIESDEVYLLSDTGADVVKVRHELMDIKRLQQVDDDGLEQWSPVMKASLPLSADDFTAVAAALGVEASPPAARTSYSLAEVREELIQPNPHLLEIEVHKRRQRYTVDGCMAELTEVRAGRTSTRTIAIESEDPTRVIATVRGHGVPGPNVNFVRGLRAMVGFGIERFGVIDVGTNSVKFHVAERSGKGTWDKVVDRAEITRLGEGLDQTGRLNPEPMARTMEAITQMAEEASRHRVAAIAAVGTAGLRIAPNGLDFVSAVQARCGVLVDIISGENEGRLAYLAATTGLGVRGSLVVFDTGGGSSQFTFGNADRVDERFSVEVGAVRLTEDYGLDGVVSEEVLAAALGAIGADLERLDGRERPETLVGMGGAVANLAAVKHGLVEYDADVVHGTVLDRTEIDRQIELYRTHDAAERRSIAGLQPQRADIILAGACVVRTVLDKLDMDWLRVSDRGLRHGVLAERFG